LENGKKFTQVEEKNAKKKMFRVSSTHKSFCKNPTSSHFPLREKDISKAFLASTSHQKNHAI
jgi:hypothetical protein